MKLRILDAASQDLVDGYGFYERQQVGLGDYFLDALFADIDSLMLYAGIHAVFFGSFYRLLAKRFPFAVFYRIEEDEVRVYAVLDCRRNPAWIRAHLTQST
jgi:plasmid stabilization system protein ParE